MEVESNTNDIFNGKYLFTQDIPVHERAAFFNKLFFHYKNNWQGSFSLMLLLSVGIASLGLSENSSPTIIGAMIIAPLGQPIVALGGAIAFGWRRQSFRMLGIIILGTIAALSAAYLIGLTLPDLIPDEQILERTIPDLRDLGIAFLAGAAGSYGYYRSEYSSVLSGVAISVALVPPICTCGLMLEQGNYLLASGSFLLFFTNFLGIALAAIVVFFLLGLKHIKNRRWFYTGTITLILLGSTAILPLGFNYEDFNSGTQYQKNIYEKAKKVLTHSNNSPMIKNISIHGRAAIITIDPFPDNNDEEQKLKIELEQTTGLQVFLKSNDMPY
jgi:uncharacterized hydrophobic protein (TIGR00271 family)